MMMACIYMVVHERERKREDMGGKERKGSRHIEKGAES